MRENILLILLCITVWMLMGCESRPSAAKLIINNSASDVRYKVAVVKGHLMTNWSEGQVSVARYKLESRSLGWKLDVSLGYYTASASGPLPGRAVLVLEPMWSGDWRALGWDAGRSILSQTTATVASVEESIRTGLFLPQPESWLPETKATEIALGALNFRRADLDKITVSIKREPFGWCVHWESKPNEHGEIPLGAYGSVVVADNGAIMCIYRGF